jgi:hypothetical protein
MEKDNVSAIKTAFLLLFIITFSLLITGCEINEKYERVVKLSEPFGVATQFEVKTYNGSISIAGVAVGRCDISAKITGKGTTIEDAEKVANSIEIKIEYVDNKFITRIDKPALLEQQYYSIDFDITLPTYTNLELHTHNGSVKTSNVDGNVNSSSHNGSITTENISGSINLSTHNGDINCSDFFGKVYARTHNGSISVDYYSDAFNAIDADIATHNGGIDIKTPDGLSVALDASTHNGSIKTSIPVSVVGEINKKSVRGKIGTGKGNLILRTHNGSILIR